MNKFHLFTVIACTFVMTACSKQATSTDPLPVQDNTAAYLQTGNWRMTVFTIAPALNGVTDVIANQPPCVNDNLLQFRANGVFILDEGLTKCSAADTQTDQGTWNYDASIKQLTFSSARAGNFVINVNSSSATGISGTRTVLISGVTYIFSGTLTKQ